MHEHEIYLKRCFDLAKQGETLAFPNPIVGCVIVHESKIIGEGFHRCCGEAHAEVNAVADSVSKLEAQGWKLEDIVTTFSKSTIYVSLEPCAHHGKTPPCADLIIKHKFKRLVFSSCDPNPLVSGQGIERIRAAGIEVIEPKDLDAELVKESDFINRVFFKTITPNTNYLTPNWLTLKIAATAEGSMISESKWITNSESRKDVHRLRSTHQLLVTTIATVRADNPLYTVRHSPEELELADIRNPDIVILKSSSNFTEAERESLNIFQDKSRKILEYRADKDDPKSLEKFIQEMVSQGYQKIMIEAGPSLSQAFINSGLVDEIIYYLAANNILSNIIPRAPFLNQQFTLSDSEVLDGIDEEASNIKVIYSKVSRHSEAA